MKETPRQVRQPAERGQAILEFAMIVPMLFLMLVGVVYFAMGFNLQQTLHAAAFEGARVWAKNPPAGSARACSPPACDPNGDPTTENNFEKYIKPAVRKYLDNNGFDGSKVIFYHEAPAKSRQRAQEISQHPELVTITLLYPYNLPIGNFASEYLTVKVGASVTLRRG
jgi:hypothetical protein